MGAVAGSASMREWISVADRLPEQGERVLVYMTLSETIFPASYTALSENWDGGEWEGDDEFFFHEKYVKYWMPLPGKPNE